jgi:hypothetical protein
VYTDGVNDNFADGPQNFAVKFASTLKYQHEEGAEETKLLPEASLSVTNEDDESADVILDPGTTNTTTECSDVACALIAHISLRITSEPVVPLKIPIVSSVPEEGVASMSEVVFDSSNWQDTIYIDIIGVDDMYDDDDQSYTIKIGPTNTTEDGYNNFEFSLDYINVDDDTYGLTTTILQRKCSEWGNEAQFIITLDSMPIEPVLYSISSMDATEGIANPSLIVLAGDNWQQGVSIMVAGQQDSEDDGLVTFGIQVAPMISRDELYLNMPMRQVFLECEDQPANYVRVYASKTNKALVTSDLGLGEIVVEDHDESWTLDTTEAGTEDEFWVTLNKWHGLHEDDEQPFELIQVRAEIDSVSALEAMLIGGSQNAEGTQYRILNFDSTNWNIPQQIRVRGVDDDSVDGLKTVPVTLSATVSTIGSPTIRNVPSYKIHPSEISVLNEDLDTAHVSAMVSALTPVLRTSENGDFVIIDVALSSRPLFDVTFSSTVSDTDEGGIIDGQTFTIMPELWDRVYNIKVVGQDDLGCAETMCPDGDIEYDLVIGPSVSADPNYNGWTMTFLLTNTDNDIADVWIEQFDKKIQYGMGAPVDETGTTQQFAVKLPKRPLFPATIQVWSDDPEEGVVDKEALVFNAQNYGTWQYVTITGVADDFTGCGPPKSKEHRFSRSITRGVGTDRCQNYGNSRFGVHINTTSGDDRYDKITWSFNVYNDDVDLLTFCDLNEAMTDCNYCEQNTDGSCAYMCDRLTNNRLTLDFELMYDEEGNPVQAGECLPAEKKACETHESGTQCKIGVLLGGTAADRFVCDNEMGVLKNSGLPVFEQPLHIDDVGTSAEWTLTQAIEYCGTCCDSSEDVIDMTTGDDYLYYPGTEEIDVNTGQVLGQLRQEESRRQIKYLTKEDGTIKKLRYFKAADSRCTSPPCGTWTLPDFNEQITNDADGGAIPFDIVEMRAKPAYNADGNKVDAEGTELLDDEGNPIPLDPLIFDSLSKGFSLVEYDLSCPDDCASSTSRKVFMSDRTLEERNIAYPSVCAMKTRCDSGNKFLKMDVSGAIDATAREEITIERTSGPAKTTILDEEQALIDGKTMITFSFDVTNFDVPSVMTITGIDEEIDDGDITVDITFNPTLTYVHRIAGMDAQYEIDNMVEVPLATTVVTNVNVDDDNAAMTVEQQYTNDEIKELNCNNTEGLNVTANCSYTLYSNEVCDGCISFDEGGNCLQQATPMVAASQAECEHLCTQDDECGCVSYNATASSCVSHVNCTVHTPDHGVNCTNVNDVNTFVMAKPQGTVVSS